MKFIVLMVLLLMPLAGADPLTGKWELVELNGKRIDKAGKTPFLQFTASSGRIEGLGGCNRFGGSFKQIKNSIEFGMLSSTMMECLGPEMKIEDEFLKTLSLKLTYKKSKNELHFRQRNTIVMKLKR